MHRLVTDAIISIVFFIIAPAQTLGVVTLVLFVVASAIAFVAIITYKGLKKITKSFLICAVINGIITCGVLFVITLLYIVFINNGLKSAGLGGQILSLLPPFIAFVIGFIAERKYSIIFTSTESVNVTTEQLLQQPNYNTSSQNGDDDREAETSQ